MIYLTETQLLLIHSIVVDETGGSHGVRDREAVLSIVVTPRQVVFGKELYPTVFTKAATYARNIILNHPFVDGNKRTGVTAGSVFLETNGYMLEAKPGAIEQMAWHIIAQRLAIDAIAAWFKRHARAILKKA